MFRPRPLCTAILSMILSLSGSAHAELAISLANMTGPTSGVGAFEVLLTNTEDPGGLTFDVASFSFALMVPASSGVQFTAADSSTTSAPYVFDGTGGAAVDPGFMLSLDTFPNAGFTASDTEFTFSSISVNPGDVFGLGLISYAVSPNAPGGDVQISFVLGGTSLSDASEAAIDFSTDESAGVIHLSVVPEPSSLLLTASALGITLLGRGPHLRPKSSP